jgi:3',5'-cyclic AMP phosphodiesterase CpdA
MSRLVHLSDLHFGALLDGDVDRQQATIHQGLVATLGTLREVDALVVTGDVFDSFRPPAGVLDGFAALLERCFHALGGPVTTLLLPGNHDRRDDGVFGPWSGELFKHLAERLRDFQTVRVLGNRTPFLAEHVELPGLPADVVAYDSSYLPRGLVSAGGQVRQEDLVQLGSQLAAGDEARPLLFLLHHHLVPTPVTDTAVIHTAGRPLWQRFLVGRLLPDLVGNGDREELTMTALGAGTALSTLHSLGRAVVVLHGHKHYPAVRLLKGLGDEADVLVTSAGSCGRAQDFSSGGARWEDAPKLWPSLNVVEVTADGVEVTNQAWSPTEPTRRNTPHQLVSARREGRRWELRAPPMPRPFEPVLALNESVVRVSTSSRFIDRYDLEVRRTVKATAAAFMPVYRDLVEGPPGAKVTALVCGGVPGDDAVCPTQVEVPMRGGEASWRVLGGAVASTEAASALRGDGACFESVELLNRSRAHVARLRVHLGPVTTTPFASTTDLTTGKERPLKLRRDGDAVVAEYEHCPARVLLRVYWPL